ncbi:iron chelate uptake ABC transporter family permease subunit [uncultured Streptomyces sp.]|uniref:FecCD family ABC transporter permease n=1 Tax=uncultured Streptomyces sp. TaxID=174707 RepID=UPI00261DEB66|nr:iron ABC transporter permease [uncultured Streptomyces sp.]
MLVCSLLAAGSVAAFCVSLVYGDMHVPLSDVLSTLVGRGDTATWFIVGELRLPRALIAALVGLAFGTSGALFQSLLRNPLASPDIIGISAGASAAAVLGSTLFAASGLLLSGWALGGALVAGALIYGLARRRGVTGARLVLVGVGVSAGLTSLVSYLMTRSQNTEAQAALLWMAGSLNGRSWTHLWPLLWTMVVLVPLVAVASRQLTVLQLGQDTAAGLGARVEQGRVRLLLLAVALAGCATAAVGPVGFVAFVAGPVAQRLAPGRGASLAASGLTGALLVLVADFAAQHALGSTQFPVGVVTSVIGAPYLLWLLTRTNRAGQGG